MDLHAVYQLYFRNIILSNLHAPQEAGSLIHCGAICSKTPRCYSFFYNNVNHDCYLVDGFVKLGGNDTEARNNIAYYGTTGDVPQCPTDLGFQLEASLNICYKLHFETLAFYTARAVCQGEGGDLATLKTSLIENFYIRLLISYNEDMFFGATDAGSPGIWRWMDGTLWSAFSRSHFDKHCLEFDDNTMDVELCEDKEQGFVCEVVLPQNYF